MTHKTYSESEKKQAATAYVMTGSTVKAGALADIPGRTIRGWTTRDWWAPLVDMVRLEKQDEMDAKITGIMDKALDGISQKLSENEAMQKVALSQLAVSFGIMFDKRQILRNAPTSISAKNTDLKALAQEFAALARSSDPKVIETIGKDGETDDD
jgi:hypothetical protein